MAARAIWKGVIRFGRVEVPVKFYSAVQDRSVHFRLLHKKDRAPLEQKMVHPRTGQPVAYDQMRRGFQTEEGDIVVFSEEELEALEPETSREIEILRFVPRSKIGHQWYDRPYYMGPDGDESGYFALAEALEEEGMEGVARWAMRKKRYVGALGASGGFLKMITLFPAEQVVDASALPRPEGRDLETQELRMAEQLMGMLEGDFDPSAYPNEYNQLVLELIRKKAQGEVIELKKVKERRPKAASLKDLLEQSLKQAKKEKKSA